MPNFLKLSSSELPVQSLPFHTWSNPWKEQPTFAAFIVSLLPTPKALQPRFSLQHSAKTLSYTLSDLVTSLKGTSCLTSLQNETVDQGSSFETSMPTVTDAQ